ncbi:MAG: GAF domain-containing sensor histidine kinase [candidate division KSB1 bacterium]|nr:GAF domain-containing sensor histidine kinase [candidate division KSB1 bacterium]
MMNHAKSSLAKLPIEYIELIAENNRRMFCNLHSADLFATILDIKFSPRIKPTIGLLFIIDTQDNELKLVATKGIDEAAILTPRVKLGKGLIGRIAQQGKIYITNRIDDSELIFHKELIPPQALMIGLPLNVMGKVLGLLSFFMEGHVSLPNNERAMLQILSGHAAIAIQNNLLLSRLMSNNDDLDFLVQIAQDLASSLELSQVLKKILKASQQIAKTNNSFLWYRDLVTKRWRRKFPDNLKLADLQLPNIENGEGIIGHVYKTGEPYLCNDVTNDPYYHNTWPETRSEIAAPLIIDGAVEGILNIESTQYNAFTNRDLKLLTMLAANASVALRNAQLYAIADEKNRHFITLRQISEELGQQKSLNSVLSSIAQESLNIVGQGKKICFVMLVDPEKNKLETKAIAPEIASSDYFNFYVDLNQNKSIVVWVARNGEARIANDVRKDPEYLEIFPEIRSEICVPLRFRNEIIGVIDIESSELNAFTDHDLDTLQALAESTAIAIKIGELCDIRLRQLQVLYEIGRKITSTLDLDQILNLLAKETLAAIGPQDRILYVQLVDYDQKMLIVKAFAGDEAYQKDYLNRKTSLDEGISGEVVRTQRHYLCADVKNDDYYLEVNPHVQSELIVPIIYDNQVTGLINVESFKKNDFGQYEVHLLQQLANHAGIAIENARLNEELSDIQFQVSEAVGLSAVTDVLSGLTHDIRTASSLISGEAQWIEYLHENQKLESFTILESMKKIQAQVDRIERMTTEIMERSRSMPIEFERANLADITQTVIYLTSGFSRRHKVEFQIDRASLNFTAMVDPHRLHRVFINIIKNAIEAMPDGGIITIRAKRFKDYFEIHFHDSGKGMEESARKKVWDPFFSMKQGGFGLGLPICKRIIELEHNGKITLRSVKDKGTNVKIRLRYEQT